MRPMDEKITRLYFRLEEAQRQRLWLQRVWHPELFDWKNGGPPPITRAKLIRRDELSKLGFGEPKYREMAAIEKETKRELEETAQDHVLWPHWDQIKGLSSYSCGAFVAAAGDIERPGTVSSFWRGMGLDVLPDGTVPRRVRGKKTLERRVPCLPHVSRVGEQIRQNVVRSNGALRRLYDHFRARYDTKYPDRPKTFNFRAAVRITQKILYACSWRVWREAYGLPAPMPYAFDILKHNGGDYITMVDLYEPIQSNNKQRKRKE